VTRDKSVRFWAPWPTGWPQNSQFCTPLFLPSTFYVDLESLQVIHVFFGMNTNLRQRNVCWRLRLPLFVLVTGAIWKVFGVSPTPPTPPHPRWHDSNILLCSCLKRICSVMKFGLVVLVFKWVKRLSSFYTKVTALSVTWLARWLKMRLKGIISSHAKDLFRVYLIHANKANKYDELSCTCFMQIIELLVIDCMCTFSICQDNLAFSLVNKYSSTRTRVYGMCIAR